MTQKSSPPLQRAIRFLRRPWTAKVIGIRRRFKPLWNRVCPGLPLPVRLPFGAWWLAGNDCCGDAIFIGWFETHESRFVQNFLREGMTVLDLGAHGGFYTLLAARLVKDSGHVFAFEPSPRERRRLLLHQKVNRCHNVTVEDFAVSDHTGKATFFVVRGRDTGCNSLRSPVVSEPTEVIDVRTITVDGYLKNKGVRHVDFIKMDVEGAELAALQGAEGLLTGDVRPLILLEIQDLRTAPWGYAAVAIHDYLEERNYCCFTICAGGRLISCRRSDYYDLNAVAVPHERLREISALIQRGQDAE